MTIVLAVKKGYPLLKSTSDKGPEYEIRYSVVTTNASLGPGEILDALPFAQGDPYVYEGEEDPSVLCTEISTPERTGPLTWEASCIFTRMTPPFLRAPEFGWSHDDHQHPIVRAWRQNEDGTWNQEKEPVINSAGGNFDKPMMRDVGRLVLKMTRNEPYYPLAIAREFENKINDDVFLGWEAGTILCKHIDATWATEQFEGEWIEYWRVTYEFVFDGDGWVEEFLDQGPYFRDTRPSVGGNPNPNFNKLCAVRDKDGVPMHGPFLLDGAGGLLSDADALAGNVKYRRYDYRLWVSFAPLNIAIPG
jgi:hypothetical protein